PGCRLLPDAVQAGSCLLVRSKTRWHLWVPQLDPAHHRPATVWETEALDDAPITPRGAERSAFQQSLLAALSAVETLGVRAWLTDADSRTSGAQRGQHRSQLAADRGEGARHNETGLPPLPHEVDSGIREELLRVNRIRIGLQMAVTALRAGQTSSSRSRAAAAVHHIEQLSDLQRSARAYTDALWDRAFALCRPSS
ncbi:MAG: hypothetical protein EB027_06290, partial [Actinobacteria bacterium]|nr:hypothetical protein [Actinomycetota bacterium]